METNDSDMSFSEWDIVVSSSLDAKECPKQEDSEDVMVIYSSENATEEDVPKGSSVEDILQEHEVPQCESSCSSSDIDIIDENVFDDHHSDIPIPSIELSLSSSFETNMSASLPALSVRESTPEPVTDIIMQLDSPRRNPHIKDYCIIFGIGCLLAIFMHIPETPVDTIKEMEKRIIILQEENRELKSHVISKIEDDKPFVALEEQITALKGENSKLSRFMQDLIRQLEEKTIIFKKESEIKGKESYKKEIDKLKEQVNILQIDNDELQKQLVRMRYSVYSPPTQDNKNPSATQKQEASDDKTEDQNENSTEVLSEEIKELRKKLYSEVEKLKNWKESVQHLMTELENRPKESNKKREYGSKESVDKADKFASKKSGKENQYDGKFVDSKDDPNEAIGRMPELNITDLVFRYIGVDKKKVKGVFESVGHYFKKAQEKTKDIFDENMKNDMWNFIGGLRKQWHMMKKTYFPKHHKKAQSQEHEDNKPRYAEKPEKSEKNHKKDSKHYMEQETSGKRHSNQHFDNKNHMEQETSGKKHSNQHLDTKDEFQKEQNSRVQENSKWQSYKQNLENLAETPLNSWLFERAAHRSELRETEEEVNWFLKNRKDADVPESHKLEQEKQTADPYENFDFYAMD